MRRWFARIAATTMCLTLILAPCLWIGREYRQKALDQALVQATVANKSQEVSALLERGAHANTRVMARDDRPAWQMLWALIHGEHQTQDSGETVLQIAAGQTEGGNLTDTTGNTAIVKSLLEHGAHPNIEHQDG